MTEEEEVKESPFDAEWEIAKMRARFTDILNMIEELKSKDRTLSARISRLRIARIEEDEEEEGPPGERERPDIDHLSIEDRALLFSKLLDKMSPETPEHEREVD